METNIKTIIHLITIVLTALSAGLFYGWVVSVIPGTKKISDTAFLETMQTINKEILNPGFFAIFFGAGIFLMACSFIQYQVKIDVKFYLVLAACLIYLFGTIGVTMLGNVPLNNVVESLDLQQFSLDDFKQAREAYELKWNQFNLIRTVAALISFILVLYAIVK